MEYFVALIIKHGRFSGGITKTRREYFWACNRNGIYAPRRWMFPIGDMEEDDGICEIDIRTTLSFDTLIEAQREYLREVFTRL